MVRTVLYDAGACSKDNADSTREKNVHYVFVLTEGQPPPLAEARRHHAARSKPEADDVTEEVRAGGLWRRSVYVETTEDGWLDWDHLRTCVRFVSERLDKDGNVTSTDERYYISSLPADRFLASRWNLLLRRRWAVENDCHHTFDTVFAEDDRRWIETDPVGALVIVILRRIAYSMLAFYRAVTLRSEERRNPPWKDPAHPNLRRAGGCHHRCRAWPATQARDGRPNSLKRALLRQAGVGCHDILTRGTPPSGQGAGHGKGGVYPRVFTVRTHSLSGRHGGLSQTLADQACVSLPRGCARSSWLPLSVR